MSAPNPKRMQMFSYILLGIVFFAFIMLRNRSAKDPDSSTSSGDSSSSITTSSSDSSSTKPPLINDWRVHIIGAGLDLIVSYDDLREQPLVTVEGITSTDAATGETLNYGVEGPSLGALLAAHGIDLKTLGSITCFAGEAAHTVIPRTVLEQRDVILALDSTLLGVNHEPMCVVPDADGGDFRLARVTRIELSSDMLPDLSAPTVTKVTVFNHAGAAMTGTQVDGSLAYPLHELYRKQFGSPEGDLLRLVTQHGLNVYQRTNIASDFRLSAEGEHAPRYFHQFEDAQVGLLSYLRADRDAVVFLSKQHKLTDLMATLGMADAEHYIFTAHDGYSVNIEARDLDSGTISLQSGVVTLIFNGLPDNTTINGLLSIEAV